MCRALVNIQVGGGRQGGASGRRECAEGDAMKRRTRKILGVACMLPAVLLTATKAVSLSCKYPAAIIAGVIIVGMVLLFVFGYSLWQED